MNKHARYLAIGSCQLPTSIMDRDYGLHNWHKLRDAETGHQIDALLLLGDQVYSDPSAGLWDSKFLWEAYGEPYGRLLRFIDNTGLSLPVISVPDDHEIIEGWEPVCDESAEADFAERNARFELGMHNYLDARLHDHDKQTQQHLAEGFSAKAGTNYNRQANRHLHHERTVADLPLFICNTRMERQHRHAGNWNRANIMGEIQFSSLCHWLNELPEQQIKLVASPAALLPRYLPAIADGSTAHNAYPFTPGTLKSDSWDGFPNTLLRLLAFIVDRQIHNVVFLSGDLHFASITQATISNSEHEVTITSAHCSALYAPYALANARPAQFRLDDTFSFRGDHFSPAHGSDLYRVESKTHKVRTGDGFCYLGNAGDGLLDITFTRHSARMEGCERYQFDPSGVRPIDHSST